MPRYPVTGQVQPHESCMAQSNPGRGCGGSKGRKKITKIDQQVGGGKKRKSQSKLLYAYITTAKGARKKKRKKKKKIAV